MGPHPRIQSRLFCFGACLNEPNTPCDLSVHCMTGSNAVPEAQRDAVAVPPRSRVTPTTPGPRSMSGGFARPPQTAPVYTCHRGCLRRARRLVVKEKYMLSKDRAWCS